MGVLVNCNWGSDILNKSKHETIGKRAISMGYGITLTCLVLCSPLSCISSDVSFIPVMDLFRRPETNQADVVALERQREVAVGVEIETFAALGVDDHTAAGQPQRL